jgi:hypothetical protein
MSLDEFRQLLNADMSEATFRRLLDAVTDDINSGNIYEAERKARILTFSTGVVVIVPQYDRRRQDLH